MLKVKNGKTINLLAKSNLKEYKMRNIFTLITIILSVSLLAFTAFIASAMREADKRALQKSQHVIYHEVSEQQAENIRQQEQIKNSGEFKKGKSFEKDNYILMPFYKEQSGSPMFGLPVKQGEYPQEMNQVLVDEKLLEYMALKPETGQRMTIHFLDKTVEEFTVSGILKSEEDTEVFPVYFSREYAKRGSQLKDIPFDIAAQVVNAEKMSSSEFLDVIRQIGAAILFVSSIVIYSIFYIWISERTRQFGQLRTLGMTKKQVKRMVRKEGMFFSLAGSVTGIAIGAGIAYSIKPKGFCLPVFIIYSLAIFAANYITVQLSISRPAKIAADISPIEASKISGYEIKNGSTETKKLQRNLSPFSLSLIGVRFNRKKSRMTFISLSLAGIIFMCASVFVNSIDEEKYSRKGWFTYGDYVINLSSNAAQVNDLGYTGLKCENPLNSELVSELRDMEGVGEVMELMSLDVSFTYNDVTSNDIAASFSRAEASLVEQHLKDGTLNYDKMMENKEIIIANNDLIKEIYGWKFELGDKITMRWFDGEEYAEDVFTVAGTLEGIGKESTALTIHLWGRIRA